MMNFMRSVYRQLRVATRQIGGREPIILIEERMALEYFGSVSCGWALPVLNLDANSVIIDIGLGEDISFTAALQERFGCVAHGFDPTPKAIAHVERVSPKDFTLHRFALAKQNGKAMFHLPNKDSYVSGTIAKVGHTGQTSIEVDLITIGEVFSLANVERINVLKLDVEGAEYDVILDEGFADVAPLIDTLCIEFHHRWPEYGKNATVRVVERLRQLGFRCCWRARATNEEFTFVNRRKASS